jgi:arylsulfatase A-like enzyme
MLVRMDGLLADLFGFLDARIGKGRYLAVLTADHGASPAPEYLQRYRPTIEAGRVSPRFVQAAIESTMVQAFGVPAGSKDWHATLEGESIYLDKGLLKNHGLDPVMVARELARALPAIRGVGPAAATEDLYRSGGTTVLEQKLRRSCYPGRVGDVVFSARPYFVGDEGDVGASHGEPYEYDSHVPLMIMGPGVLPGRYLEEVSPADIAPTLAALMGVEFPAARTGRALVEALVMERGKNRK